MARHESNSILERAGLAPENGADVDQYSEDAQYRAFGVCRKPWAGEPMINFINRQGDHQAIAYSHLYRVRFDPSDGITLEFTNNTVKISGRNFLESYQKLVMHRVIFVVEADDATRRLVADDEPVVTSLQILEPDLEPQIR